MGEPEEPSTAPWALYTRPRAAACGTERCRTSMMGPTAQPLPTLTSLGLLKPKHLTPKIQAWPGIPGPGEDREGSWGLSESS